MYTELGLLRKNIFINEKKIIAVEDAFMQLRKESLSKFRFSAGIRTLTLAIPVQRSNQLSHYKPTGSYSLNWFATA